jgi:membrane fusion protein
VSFSVLTLLFSLIAVVILAFFFLFGFTRSEATSGVLLPAQGLIRVYAPQTGMLVERKVADGQAVREGDILFVLSGERASSAKGDTQFAVSGSLASRIARLKDELTQQQRLTHQQQTALLKRRADLQAQMTQLEAEIILQQRRMQMADATAQRYADLKKSQFVSDAQVQDRLAEVIEQQSRLRALERNRAALSSDLTTLDAERLDQPLKAQREASAIERAIAELEQGVAENEARRQIVVRSPRAGIVTAVVGEPGQFVGTNLALAAVLPPNSALEAELYAPSRAVGFVKPGTEVWLRYQAFPYQKFGQQHGVVREVSSTPLQPNDIGLPLTRDPGSTEPLYRIRVRLDAQTVKAYGAPEPLKAGMQLEASLALEYRKLAEWVIDPIYSVTGKL